MTRIGFPVALLYVFGLFSMINEFSIIALGVKPYFTWITGPLGLVAAISSGNLLRCWRPGPGRWMLLFTAWMGLAAAFGIFHAGALTMMEDFVFKQLPSMLLLAALTTNMRQVQWFCRMMAYTGLIVVGLSVKFGALDDNRLLIPNTTLGNPNDLATHLLITLPFCLLIMLNSSPFSLLKVVGGVGAGGVALTLVRTGSRAGLITMVAFLILILWRVTSGQRMMLIVVCIVCGVLASAIFPQILFERFKTIVTTDVQADNVVDMTTINRAAGSTQGRWYVLRRSLYQTFHNPIFGLGPGNFSIAEANVSKEAGTFATWLGTHNSYTQASSEGGIPAFIFFTAAIFSAIRSTSRIHRLTAKRPEFKSIANIALCLMLTISGFAVNILFAHMAYRYYLPMLIGISIAFVTIAEREIQEAR